MYKIDYKYISLLGIFILFLFSCSIVNTTRFNDKNSSKKREIYQRSRIVEKAEAQIGVRYKYAGKTPSGFDCSGFTEYVFKNEATTVKGPSKTQARLGEKVKISKAKSGDLILFGSTFKINHVGIIVRNIKGELWVVHSTSSQGVIKQNIYKNSYWKKRIKFARNVISP